MRMKIALGFLQALCIMSHSYSLELEQSDEKMSAPHSRLIITTDEILNLENEDPIASEIIEEQEFDALLTETADALRKSDSGLLKKLVVVVDRVGNIEKSIKLPASLQTFRDHFIATIVEWFHLLLEISNDDIIRSKLKGLNKNLFTQFRKNRNLALRLISDMAQRTFAAGLSGEEQIILFNLVVENGAIERIKSIAVQEMALQLGTNVPGDTSILKTMADLMVEKVFESKYHEIEKKFIHENEVDTSLIDLEGCENLKCSERHANKRCPRKCGKHANLKVDLLHSNKAFDNIHKKSTNQEEDVQNINILLQALRSRPLIRRARAARRENIALRDRNEEEETNEISNQEKKIKHSFKTRIHGGNNKRRTVISEVPIRNDEVVVQEAIDVNIDGGNKLVKSQEENDGKEKVQITMKEDIEPIHQYSSNHHISNVDATEKQDKNQAKKQNTLTELDITKEFIPKFQGIYADQSMGPKEKDRQMIRLITDMMSDPRVQASIVKMLEKHLKSTDVRKATHLVLMAMERTSFGSGEDVLEEMFATWEPFLSKAIELLGVESLAKVCAIHAAVEKVAKPHQQSTLRQLTKKVLNGLSDRGMAQRLSNGMAVALHGDHNDILIALRKDPKVLKSEIRAKKLKEKLLKIK